MTERLIVPGTAPAKSETNSSPILAMQHRYDAAWQEYNRIDVAATALRKDHPDDLSLEFAYRDGMTTNNAETDALRPAILYQVPTTWVEAMVLQFHINIAHDLVDEPSVEDRAALATAMDTLLDFMCCEVDQDHEALGRQFQTSANMVFDKRRYRTGIVELDA